MADRDDTHDEDVVWDAESLVDHLEIVCAEEPCSQSLIDGSEQNRHHGCACVDPPVRHGPVRFRGRCTIRTGLVRL